MQLRLQQQLIYNTHILTAKHKMFTNVYKCLQMIIIQFIILLQKIFNSSLRNLGHTNPCSKKKSNPISFSKKCKKPLYSIMQRIVIFNEKVCY